MLLTCDSQSLSESLTHFFLLTVYSMCTISLKDTCIVYFFLEKTLANLIFLLSSLSVGVYPGDCSPAGAQRPTVWFSDSPLWLLHLCKPPGCSGHLEVQVLLQGPCSGVLLYWYVYGNQVSHFLSPFPLFFCLSFVEISWKARIETHLIRFVSTHLLEKHGSSKVLSGIFFFMFKCTYIAGIFCCSGIIVCH